VDTNTSPASTSSTRGEHQRSPPHQGTKMAGGFSVSAPSGVEFEAKITPIVIISCLMAATGGLMFGYDVGISGTPGDLLNLIHLRSSRMCLDGRYVPLRPFCSPEKGYFLPMDNWIWVIHHGVLQSRSSS